MSMAANARRFRFGLTAAVCAVIVIGGSSTADDWTPRVEPRGEFISSQRALADIRESVRRGEIVDPAARTLPPVVPRGQDPTGPPPCLTTQHVFPYEDSESLLISNFSDGQLFTLMSQAANALMTEHGDNFDFIGFWINFQAHHQIGAAFYLLIENDVEGIGLALFNNRPQFGVAGENIEGFVMMWDVNNTLWQPGTGFNAIITRLILAQEFEHRFAMFLPQLPDGRRLQGDDQGCGRSSHWSFRVDGQGSGMEIAEWIGEDPAYWAQSSLFPNTDAHGMYSFTDLYLMGYVSPQEMDQQNSELRYLDFGCVSPYTGPISTFESADIIAGAGPRVPNSADAQKHFKVGWVMLHLPGAPPTAAQLSKAVKIHEQFTIDWYNGTLHRGTMDNSLFPDCNCNGVPDGPGAGDHGGCTVAADRDGDGDVDYDDFAGFAECDTGPGADSLPPECETYDFDLDADVDASDFQIEQLAFTDECALAIVQQPSDAAVCPGENVVFEADIAGRNLEWIWHRNGVFLATETGPSMVIEDVGPADEGVYGVLAHDVCGFVFSDGARLTVHSAPEITSEPDDTATCLGDALELAIEAVGFEPIAYQWRFDGNDIPGATGPTLVIDPVEVGDLGSYQCVLVDGCDQETLSTPAEVFVPDLQFTLQPVGGEVCAGESIFMFVIAPSALSFQWFKDGEPIPGATSSFLAIPDADAGDSGVYHVLATGLCESLASDEAVIEVINCSAP